MEEIQRLLGKEPGVDERADKLREALVPERAADDGLRFRDAVPLLVWCRIAVWVGYERVSRVYKVGLGRSHEFGAVNLLDLERKKAP